LVVSLAVNSAVGLVNSAVGLAVDLAVGLVAVAVGLAVSLAVGLAVNSDISIGLSVVSIGSPVRCCRIVPSAIAAWVGSLELSRVR